MALAPRTPATLFAAVGRSVDRSLGNRGAVRNVASVLADRTRAHQDLEALLNRLGGHTG